MSDDINAKLGNLIQMFSKYMKTTIEPVTILPSNEDNAVISNEPIVIDKQRLLEKAKQLGAVVQKNNSKLGGTN